MSLLERILHAKVREVAALRAQGVPPAYAAPPLDVVRALARPPGAPLGLVAEVKFRSPSAGVLSQALDAPRRALAYAVAGARMISVLCDGEFFAGSYAHLAQARRALDERGLAVPLLAKEFVIDELQLAHARSAGASAVLLIARVVSAPRLRELAVFALENALEPLVEVATLAELDAALATPTRVIGVNARDLDTLVIDRSRAERVLGQIPTAHVAVHLSGIKGPEQVRAIALGRADAALVGEVLMREDDPTELLAALVAAG